MFSHQTDIQIYSEMLALISSVQTQIKNQGLHDQSLSKWLESLTDSAPKSTTTHEINPRVQKIPVELTLLGTSDVIESLFGKYKIFSQRQPIKELGARVDRLKDSAYFL